MQDIFLSSRDCIFLNYFNDETERIAENRIKMNGTENISCERKLSSRSVFF